MKFKKVVHILIITMMIMNFLVPLSQVSADETSSEVDINLNEPLLDENESSLPSEPENQSEMEQNQLVDSESMNQELMGKNQLVDSSMQDQEPSSTVVSFNDPVFENAIRNELGIQTQAVTAADMENLYYLSLPNLGITDITGLEYAINLMDLDLSGNNINAITPILNLKKLYWLTINNNPIVNIAGIEQISNLVDLNISDTQITDLQPLLALSNLSWVNILGLPINYADYSVSSVISTLKSNGVSVYYQENQSLYIYSSKVTESSADLNWNYYEEDENSIVYNLYLNDQLVVEGYNGSEYTIDNLSPNTNYSITIEAVGKGEQNGQVAYLNFTTKSLPSGEVIDFEDPNLENAIKEELGVQNRDLQKSDLESLTYLWVSASNIRSLKGLEHAINLEGLSLGWNSISNLEPIANLQKLSTINLGNNPIKDISVLSTLPSLRYAYLNGTKITDISPLLSCSNLEQVEIKNTSINFDEDQDALGVVNELIGRGVEVAYLGDIFLDDIKYNDAEINLTWEYQGSLAPTSYKIFLNDEEVNEVADTSITLSDLQPETGYEIKIAAVRDGKLTGVYSSIHITTAPASTGKVVVFDDASLENAVREELYIYNRDLRQSDLERLTYLYVYNEGITSLNGLEYATNLRSLGLGSNSITNIEALSSLTNLYYLDLSDNPIKSVNTLSYLENLSSIDIRETEVNDISVFLEFPNLHWLDVSRIEVDYKNDTAAMSVINTLISKGVDVNYRNLGIIGIYSGDTIIREESIKISWDFYDQGEGKPTSYNVYLNDVKQDEVTETSYTFTGLTRDTEYTIKIAAVKDGMLTGEEATIIESTLPLPSGDVVVFEDSVLEDIIRDKFEIYDRDLRASDLERLSWLDLDVWSLNQKITSLKGLEYAKNLYTLFVSGNDISDLTPLSNLTSLVNLDLSNNPIGSIADLSELSYLSSLNLSNTSVSDISPVLNFPDLFWLGIRNSSVSLTDEKTITILDELKARGVEIYSKQLGHISVTGYPAENEINLSWYYYQADYEAPTSYKIYLNDKEIAEVQGLSYTITNLEPQTEYNVKIVGIRDGKLTGEEDNSYFTTSALPTGEVVKIDDENLEKTIRDQLMIQNRDLRESDLAKIEYLTINNSDIESLSGLEYAVNLTNLNVRHGKIQDLSPLKSITSLRSLDLSYNQITDISPLSQLTNLENLTLWGNQIADINSLTSMANLRYLDLESNLITDVTPLSNLESLSSIYLSNNPIVNIDALKTLNNLTAVYLENTRLDLSEGAAAQSTIQYLRDKEVYVYINGEYSENLFLDSYNVTDTTVDLNWYGNFSQENVASAKVKVYLLGETGSVPDDVYGDAYTGVNDNVYEEVYEDVYEDVYDDVYGDSTLVAEYDVNYGDRSYTVTGLNPSLRYRIELTVNLKDGSELSSSSHITTQWSQENSVENVSFIIKDQDQINISNLEVSIEGAENTNKDVFLYGYTNQNGLFQSWDNQGTTLKLPEGKYDVFVYGNGKYGNKLYEVNVTKDGVYPIEIQLNEIQVDQTTVTLEVKDPQGNPVTSLEYISLYSGNIVNSFGYEKGSYNEWGLQSDNGIYEIENITLSDDYILNLESDDYMTYSVEKLVIGENQSLKVVLDKGAELKAKVITSDGQPLTGAWYSINGKKTNVYGSIEDSGVINEIGLSEEDLTIEITMPGYLTYRGTVSATQFENGVAQLSDLILQPESFIDGYVYKSKADEPVKHAYVYLYEEGSRWSTYSGRTDENGYFKIRNVKPGKYKASVEAYNLPTKEQFDIEAGSTISVFLSQQTNGAFSGEGNSFAPSKNNAVPGEIIEYRLNYANGSQANVQNVQFKFTLPDSVEVVNDSLLTATTGVDTSKFITEKTVTLNEVAAGKTGTISFKIKVKDTATENIATSATILYGSEEVNLNSTTSLTYVTLNAPEVTADSKVKVYGSAKPGSVVKVYDGNVLLVETTVPINTRWWYADVQLPTKAGENSTHQLVAKVTDVNQQTVSSSAVKIQYNPTVPKLSEISISAGWNQNVSLNPYTGVATMAIVEYTPITIKAKFDQSIEKASIKFLGKNYALKSKDQYWEVNIPGNWSSYGEQLMEIVFEANGQKTSMAILQAIVLIDPSGYVFEGSMQNRLSGVTAVVEQEQGDGTWKPWNANAFGQVNPQVTDSEGRYGWDVIQGTWRVVFTKDGYGKYTSRNVYVPPAETQLNVPMIRESNPIVEQISVDGLTDVNPDQSITIGFDRLMDEETLKAIQVVDKDGNPVNGTLTGEEHYYGYKEVAGKAGFYEEDQTKLLSKTAIWTPTEQFTDGEYKLIIPTTVKDYSGKSILLTKTSVFTVVGNDVTAPTAPVVDDVTEQTTKVTGTAEAGTTVEIKTGSTVLGTGEVREDGTFSVTIASQKAGTTLLVSAKDAAGNVSEIKEVIVKSAPVVTGWVLDSDKWYYYESGVMKTGWLLLGSTWYFLDRDTGVMQTGWINLGGTWYYLDASGVMKTGWVNLGGTYYYLDASGAMKTGWVNLGGTYYYLDASGAMKIGWVNLGGTYYYLDASGAMKTGWVNLGGTYYYLDASGAMKTGWLYLGGTYYYLDASGAMKTGWVLVGNKYYYMYDSGSMAYNTYIGGYKIGSDGAWIQ